MEAIALLVRLRACYQAVRTPEAAISAAISSPSTAQLPCHEPSEPSPWASASKGGTSSARIASSAAGGSQRFHHHRPDREVGNEVAVHHIDVDPVSPGGVKRAHLFAQPGKVGRKDRGRDQRLGHQR